MSKIRLYIENQEVELSQDVQFSITKQFVDLENPTDIINDWSKTVSIPATPNNNKIFSHAYNEDLMYSAAKIDITKKLEFKLILDDNLVMSGYAKMNSITRNGYSKKYNITLFGKLGEIFSELKNISVTDNTDPKYYIGDFYSRQMNRLLISQSWLNETSTAIGSDGLFTKKMEDSNANDIIGWACADQGLNNEFDSKSVQYVDSNGKILTTQLKDVKGFRGAGDTETIEEAYARISTTNVDNIIREGITPRGMGEYRSYYQTPFIYMPRMFELLKKKCKQLTDYDIELDRNWFRTSNPYYSKLVMMLNRVDVSSSSNVGSINNIYTMQTASPFTRYDDPQKLYDTKTIIGATPIINSSTESIPLYDYSSHYFDISNKNYVYSTSGSIDVSLFFNWSRFFNTRYDYLATEPGFCVFITVLYEDINYQSDYVLGKFAITSSSADIEKLKRLEPGLDNYVIVDNIVATKISTISQIKYNRSGAFSTDTYKFVLPNKIFSSDVDYSRIKYKVSFPLANTGSFVSAGVSGTSASRIEWNEKESDAFLDVNIASNNNLNINIKKRNRSYSTVEFKDIWDSSKNFFDEILRYTKLFNLVWTIDEIKKKIYVQSYYTFFRDSKIENWSNRLDYSKDTIIEPNILDNRYYKFNYEDNKSLLNIRYKDKSNGVQFGELILDTKSDFNNNTKNLFKGNQVSISETSNEITWLGVMGGIFTYDQSIEDYIFTPTRIQGSPLYESKPIFYDDSGKYIKPFGQYFFYNGLKLFNPSPDNPNEVDPDRDQVEVTFPKPSVVITDDNTEELLNDKFSYINWSKYPLSYYATNIIPTYPALNIVSRTNEIDYRNTQILSIYNKPIINYDETTSYDYGTASIYKNIWENITNERYINVHKLTANVRMSSLDFSNFSFNKFVVINNQLYLPIKIYDYNFINTYVKMDFLQVGTLDNYIKSNYIESIDNFEYDAESLTIEPRAYDKENFTEFTGSGTKIEFTSVQSDPNVKYISESEIILKNPDGKDRTLTLEWDSENYTSFLYVSGEQDTSSFGDKTFVVLITNKSNEILGRSKELNFTLESARPNPIITISSTLNGNNETTFSVSSTRPYVDVYVRISYARKSDLISVGLPVLNNLFGYSTIQILEPWSNVGRDSTTYKGTTFDYTDEYSCRVRILPTAQRQHLLSLSTLAHKTAGDEGFNYISDPIVILGL